MRAFIHTSKNDSKHHYHIIIIDLNNPVTGNPLESIIGTPLDPKVFPRNLNKKHGPVTSRFLDQVYINSCVLRIFTMSSFKSCSSSFYWDTSWYVSVPF